MGVIVVVILWSKETVVLTNMMLKQVYEIAFYAH